MLPISSALAAAAGASGGGGDQSPGVLPISSALAAAADASGGGRDQSPRVLPMSSCLVGIRKQTECAQVLQAPAAVDGTRGGGDGDVPLIRRAAALRTKYKKFPTLVRIPVKQVGAHPDNRDGQGPSGSRCVELTSNILKMGFDVVEAESNGVLVEQKLGATHIRDANRRFSDGDELLAPATDGEIMYGTLSHSTLNQLMRNISSRCPVIAGKTAADFEQDASAVAEDESLSRIVDSSGKLSPGMLQAIDPAFAEAVHTGLLWEVLSSTIEEEEPDGCAVIQAALNAKNGLFLVCHEMQALARLMTLTSSSVLAGRHSQWEFVQRRMRETMPQFADDNNFIDLYAFVVDMGGATSQRSSTT